MLSFEGASSYSSDWKISNCRTLPKMWPVDCTVTPPPLPRPFEPRASSQSVRQPIEDKLGEVAPRQHEWPRLTLLARMATVGLGFGTQARQHYLDEQLYVLSHDSVREPCEGG